MVTYTNESLSKSTRGFDDKVVAKQDSYARYFTMAGMLDGVPGQLLVARVVQPPLLPQLLADTGCTEDALLEELAYFAKLQHPNIVRVVGICRAPFAAVLARMPHGCPTLEARLQNRAAGFTVPLSARERLQAGAELADGLAYLHRFDFAHRGVSSANIVCTPRGILLGEYGFCRMGTPYPRRRTLFPAGAQAYVDNEFRAHGFVGLESDIYSFGMVLWELLTGWPVVTGEELIHDRVARLAITRIYKEGFTRSKSLVGSLGRLYTLCPDDAPSTVLPAIDPVLRRRPEAPVCLQALFDLARIAAICTDERLARPFMYGDPIKSVAAQMLACLHRLPAQLDPEAAVDCILCFARLSTVIFGPCQHVCVCKACADKHLGYHEPCPLCDTPIASIRKILV